MYTTSTTIYKAEDSTDQEENQEKTTVRTVKEGNNFLPVLYK
jgi:hypothetical protein